MILWISKYFASIYFTKFVNICTLKVSKNLVLLIICLLLTSVAVGENELVQGLQEKIIVQESMLAEKIERIQQLETEHNNFQDVFTTEKGIYFYF